MKEATPATKIFVKAPLKILTFSGAIGLALVGHAIRLGPPVHKAAMDWMEGTFKAIDRKFGS